MLRNIFNRIDNYTAWHLDAKPHIPVTWSLNEKLKSRIMMDGSDLSLKETKSTMNCPYTWRPNSMGKYAPTVWHNKQEIECSETIPFNWKMGEYWEKPRQQQYRYKPYFKSIEYLHMLDRNNDRLELWSLL